MEVLNLSAFRHPWQKAVSNGEKGIKSIKLFLLNIATSQGMTQTSFNKAVHASPPYGGSGYEKPQSADESAFLRFSLRHRLGKGHLLRKVLLPAQPVVNSQYVRRHGIEMK